MDVGTQGHHEVADLLGDTVRLGALEVHRDGGGGGLGAQGGGIAGDLVFQQGDRILVADASGHHKSEHQVQQVHGDDHQEHLP